MMLYPSESLLSGRRQLALIPEFVAACGFANARAPGYEADDFLAAAVKAEEKRKGTVIVASGDRDTFQLVSKRTTMVLSTTLSGAASALRIVPS